jgi:SAM-dependent methyltransferase
MRPTYSDRLILYGLLLLALAGCAGLTAEPPAPPAGQPLDVIWVASDLTVVMEMLRAAEVGPGDVVYDLGSGDGRIVIAAAQRFGARAVGVDLDRDLLSQAWQSAVKAGVADRVTFREQDLFVTDLSPATVVTLYLSPEVNRRLRPKLLRELRPGSRIVSHEYDLGDWQPERIIEVPLVSRVHRVYLWRVPARALRDSRLDWVPERLEMHP